MKAHHNRPAGRVQARHAAMAQLDGIPAFCRIPQDVRNQAWIDNPPKPMPQSALVVDKNYEALKQARKEAGLARLKKAAANKRARDASETVNVLAQHVYRANSVSVADYKRIKSELPKPSHKLLDEMLKFDGKRYVMADKLASAVEVVRAVKQNGGKFERVKSPAPVRGASDDLAAKVAEHCNTGGAIDLAKLKAFAKANGVWNDKYASLNNGLQRMNVVNRLRGALKKNSKLQIKWPV